MDKKAIDRFLAYKKMMEKLPEAAGSKRKPQNCEECEYYHPDWKYRKCYLVQCRYGNMKSVFQADHGNHTRLAYGEA